MKLDDFRTYFESVAVCHYRDGWAPSAAPARLRVDEPSVFEVDVVVPMQCYVSVHQDPDAAVPLRVTVYQSQPQRKVVGHAAFTTDSIVHLDLGRRAPGEYVVVVTADFSNPEDRKAALNRGLPATVTLYGPIAAHPAREARARWSAPALAALAYQSYRRLATTSGTAERVCDGVTRHRADFKWGCVLAIENGSDGVILHERLDLVLTNAEFMLLSDEPAARELRVGVAGRPSTEATTHAVSLPPCTNWLAVLQAQSPTSPFDVAVSRTAVVRTHLSRAGGEALVARTLREAKPEDVSSQAGASGGMTRFESAFDDGAVRMVAYRNDSAAAVLTVGYALTLAHTRVWRDIGEGEPGAAEQAAPEEGDDGSGGGGATPGTVALEMSVHPGQVRHFAIASDATALEAATFAGTAAPLEMTRADWKVTYRAANKAKI